MQVRNLVFFLKMLEGYTSKKHQLPSNAVISSPSIVYLSTKNFSGLNKKGAGENNETVTKFGSVTVK